MHYPLRKRAEVAATRHKSRWLVVAMFSLLLTTLVLVRAFVASSAAASDGDVYLPLLRGEGEAPAVTPTPSPTPMPTPQPQPTLDPGAVPTTDGVCASGFHLIHESGTLGVINPDDFDGSEDEDEGLFVQVAARANLWDGYYCVPDQDLSDVSCSGHGTPVLVGGVASCGCDAGYVGQQCNICGPGFVPSADKTQCVADSEPPPAAVIAGSEESVDAGSVVELRAVAPAAQDAGAAKIGVSGQWRVRRGYGCLLPARDSQTCVDSVQGETAFFRTPPAGTLNMAGILFLPDGTPQAPVFGTVLSQPPGYIPINGFGKPELQPILDQMVEFMKTRCIGAGVLGVSYYGQPVGVWGLGKTFGRASSTIFEPKCGSDSDDPHVPSAPNTGNQMGIFIGSVAKTVTWATARWTFKNALAAWDTDVDAAALSAAQLVTAQRQTDGQLRLEAWSINAAGVSAKQGNLTTLGGFKDFDLVGLSASRVAVAARSLDDTLAVYIYDVSGAGQITLVEENAITGLPGGAGDTIIQVRAARLSDSRLLAALRRADDTVTYVVWDVPGNGVLAQVNAQPLTTRARDLALIVLESSTQTRLVVGMRAVNNWLSMSWYDVGAGGQLTLVDEGGMTTEIESLALTPLGETRFAAGVRKSDGALEVTSWDLVLSGAPHVAVRDSDTGGAVGHLALARIGPSGFAAVMRTANGDLKVTSWVLDGAGQLTRRGDDSAGTNNGAAVASVTYGSETPNSIVFAGVRTGEHALKVIAWNVTSPNPARQPNEGNGAGIADYVWTDSDIEALRVVGFGLPQGLLPEPARSYFGGDLPLPVSLPAAEIKDDAGVVVAQCDALASGYAEPEWAQALLKHVFAHRTGMAKSFSPNYTDFVSTYLEEIRGLGNQVDWANQEMALRNTFGEANVEAGRAALGWNTDHVSNGATDGYMIPTPIMAEWAQVFASRCLPYTFGTYQYANTGPQIMRTMIEHVSGRAYVFAEGFPQQHADTLFFDFLDTQAGVTTSANNNIFPRKTTLESAADLGDPGPIPRAWNGTSYYYNEWDSKRPFCTWDGGGCSFSAWKNADDGRVAWYWVKEQVPFAYAGAPLGTATGGMRAEPESFLQFMSEFWTTGYGSGSPDTFNPFIGEPRNNNWGISGSHNGSQGGGYAYAIHRNNGVDIFVAINQNNTKAYTKNPDDDLNNDIGALYSFITNGVNQVDWDEVEPYEQIQVAP